MWKKELRLRKQTRLEPELPASKSCNAGAGHQDLEWTASALDG